MKLSKSSFAAASLLVTLAATACSSNDNTSSPTVSAIAISPSPCAVGRTDSIQLSAMATLPDGTKIDVTKTGTWTSGNSGTATVDANGNVVGVAAGITSIKVEYMGATSSEDCTVGT